MVINRILTQRLLELYDPFWVLGLPRELQLDAVEPVKYSRDRGPSYHPGRIRTLVDTLRAGWELEPIELDNVCSGPYVLPEPVLIDGHHRLIAHAIAGRKRISVCYSGRVDLLRYLEGKRKTCPQA